MLLRPRFHTRAPTPALAPALAARDAEPQCPMVALQGRDQAPMNAELAAPGCHPAQLAGVIEPTQAQEAGGPGHTAPQWAARLAMPSGSH